MWGRVGTWPIWLRGQGSWPGFDQNDLIWSEKFEWNIKFNPSKGQVIHITKRKHPIPTKNYMYLHGVQLELVNSAKYLGGIYIRKPYMGCPHEQHIQTKPKDLYAEI
jgi:hypothetical protein